MGVEPVVSSLSGLGMAEAVLDLLRVGVTLVEPGTGRELYANREARRLAAGDEPWRDADGEVVAPDALPAARLARREPFERLPLHRAGCTVLASGALTRLLDGTEVGVVTAEDVTAMREAEAEARRSRDEVEAMLGAVPDGITAQDAGGRVVYANAAALARLGYPSVEALAAAPVEELRQRFQFGDENGRPISVDRLPGRQALLGEEPVPVIVRHRTPFDGELRWARVQALPVLDDRGSPRLAINVIEDITDLKRAEQGYRFLAEASHALSGSLDYQATLRAVAGLAVPHIADWCAVDVVEQGELTPVAVAHADPARMELALEFRARYPPRPDSLPHQIVQTGESHVVAEISDEMLVEAAVDDDHLQIMRELGMRSAMAVPMTLRGRVLGVITFVSAEAGRRFDAQDLALAQDLGLRAAVAIDNARLYESRAAIAQTLQASLLPPHLPELPGADLAAVYLPAASGLDVGGDFYDVFDVAENDWFLVVGDVCGKGAEAAAVTALARYTIRAAAVRRRSPSAILRVLNDAMLRQGTDGRFCTIACAHLHLGPDSTRLTVACGGHPAPLVLRADGGDVVEVGAPGTLLGMVDDPELEDRTASLRPGDVMVIYTDGLTDAAAPARIWSVAEISAALQAAAGGSAMGIAEQVVEAALGGVPAPRDDVALLALRMAS